MNATTIKVTGVERKEGFSEKSQKPWVKFDIHADGGSKYATFDGALANAATAAVGQFAAITYETTNFGNDLKSLLVDPNAVAAAPPDPEPGHALAQNSSVPDWDKIGLQKTRCALWAALFTGGALAGMPYDQAMVHGIQLVKGAEIDIFTRDRAHVGDDLPF